MRWFSKPWLAVFGFFIGIMIAAGGPSNVASTLTSAINGVTGNTPPPTTTPASPTPTPGQPHTDGPGSTGSGGTGSGNSGNGNGPTGGGATGGATPPMGSETYNTGGSNTEKPPTTPKPTNKPIPESTPATSTTDCSPIINREFQTDAVGSTVLDGAVVMSENGNHYAHLPATVQSVHVSGNWNAKCVATVGRGAEAIAIAVHNSTAGYECRLTGSTLTLMAETPNGATTLAIQAVTADLSKWTPLYLMAKNGQVGCATASGQNVKAAAPFSAVLNTAMLIGANDDFEKLYIAGTAA